MTPVNFYMDSYPPNVALGTCNKAINILRGPAVEYLDFTFWGYKIVHSDYKVVADALDKCTICVEINYNACSFGEYRPANTTMKGQAISGKLLLGSGTSLLSDDTSRALLVHEATHAALDLKPHGKMSILTSECLAYIAQQYFYRLVASTYILDTKKTGTKFKAAAACVDKYWNGGWPSSDEEWALAGAVAADPTYGLSSGLITAAYNG